MSLITCKNLIVGYESQSVTQAINFNLDAGNYLCIVGENGSGKTTLMKTLLSLMRPISGEIVFGDWLKNNEIGYLPQQATVKKDFPATNFEIVLSGFIGKIKTRPFFTKSEKDMALNAMKRMHVLEYKDRSFRDLSGGQQQRVLLARAICATKKVLLLDEPVSGLDPKVTKEMYSLVKELNEKDNISIIMISHNLDDAIKYASHILHIGGTIFFGTKSEYLDSEIGKRFTSL